MPTEHSFNDRLIRFPELEKIFGVCKRTVRRRAENGELPRCGTLAAPWECWKVRSKRIFKS
jgi:predicted DNA-binding transcriptional regulator AlpA